MTGTAPVWYVAYGSNLQDRLLARYVAAPDRLEARWLTVPRRVFFAGRSLRWDGAVAFLEREETRSVTHGRAVRVTWHDLARVFRGENALDVDLPHEAVAAIPVGGWHEVPMDPSPDPRRGKYNAVVRLGDVAGEAAYTFTTARGLQAGRPSGAYLDAIAAGLRARLSPAEVSAYLGRWAAGWESAGPDRRPAARCPVDRFSGAAGSCSSP